MIFDDENSFIALINFLMMPLFFTSSALVPTDNIPKILKVLVTINPFTYSINAIRSLVLNENIQMKIIGKGLAICVILSLIMFMIAINRLNNDKK